MEKKWLIIQLVVVAILVAFIVTLQERRFSAQQQQLDLVGEQINAMKSELTSMRESKPPTDASTPMEKETQTTPVPEEVQSRLERAEQAVEETTSKMEKVLGEQELMKELATDMRDRKAQRQIANMMQARYNKVLDDDITAHGKEVYELYKRSLPREGVMNLFDTESDTAFKELMAKYPSTQTAAVAVAERALACAARQDTEGATEYYNMLMENEASDQVVTSKGVEATPALIGYFASQYVQDGDYAQAQQMLNYLTENYSQNTLALRGPSGEPVYSTVDDFVQRMSSEINRSQR